MNNKFNQMQYEKLTDDIMSLGNNVVLRLNVQLAKEHKGSRYHFHSEYEYSTNKYPGVNKLVTLRRKFEYFLSIENIKSTEYCEREFIIIRIQDMYYLQNKLKEVVNDIVYNSQNIFEKKEDNKIRIKKSKSIFILNLAQDKYLEITPIVLDWNYTESTGIRIYLSSNNNYIDMTMDKFMGFVYIINSINLFQSAQILINYLQRPELGTGVKKFDNYNYVDTEDLQQVVSTTNRNIKTRKQTSFFDKMDKMQEK